MLLDYSKLTHDELVTQLKTYLESTGSFKNLTDLSPSTEYIDTLGGVAGLLIYTLERRVEELYPSTARLDTSKLVLASALNYNARRKTSSKSTLKFTLVDDSTGEILTATSSFQVPLYYRVKSSTSDTEFVTTQVVTFNVGESSKEVQVVQGLVSLNTFSSSEFPSQQFTLEKDDLDNDFVFVTVGGVTYAVTTTLAESGSDSEDVSVRTLLNYSGLLITFGDNINGKIPPQGNNNIEVTVLETKGQDGNINNINIISEFIDSDTPAGIPSGTKLIATNIDPASGGADEESIDSINANANKVFVVSDRTMVSYNNWVNQLGRFPGIKQLNVAGEFDINPTTPNIELANLVYIRILGELDENGVPTTVRTNGDLNAFGLSVQEYTTRFKDLTVRLDINDATIIPIIIDFDATIQRDKNAGIVKNKVDESINSVINYEVLSVGERVNISDLYRDITTAVPEIKYAHLLLNVYDENFLQIDSQTSYNFTAQLKNIKPQSFGLYLSDLLVGMDDGLGNIIPETFDVEPTPSAIVATLNSASGVITGNIKYKVTLVVDNVGETDPSSDSNIVAASSQQIDLSSIPTGTSRVTARKIYRSTDGGSFGLVATIPDNTTTSYTDNNTSEGDAPPTVNNTGQYIDTGGNISYTTGLGDVIFLSVIDDRQVSFKYEQDLLGDIKPEFDQIITIKSKNIEIIYETG